MTVTIITAISCIIIAALSAFLFIVMIIQHFFVKQKRKLNMVLYYIAMSALFSATTRFSITAALLLGDEYATYALSIALAIFRLLFIILIYAFYIAQLHFTFHDSAYEVSSWIIYLHLVNLCISLVFYGITFTFFELEKHVTIAENITYSIARIFFISGIIHLTYIFNHKLLKLITSNIDPSYTDPLQNNMQLNILEVVINRSVLITISYPQILLMTIISLSGGNTKTYLFAIWYCIVMCLIVSTFFFTFRMNKKAYFLFCNICHHGCTKLCRFTAAKFMLPKSEDSDSDNGGTVATTIYLDVQKNIVTETQTTGTQLTSINRSTVTKSPDTKPLSYTETTTQ